MMKFNLILLTIIIIFSSTYFSNFLDVFSFTLVERCIRNHILYIIDRCVDHILDSKAIIKQIFLREKKIKVNKIIKKQSKYFAI